MHKNKMIKYYLIIFCIVAICLVIYLVKTINNFNDVKKYEMALTKHDYPQIEYLLTHGLNPDTVLEDYQDTDFWAILKFKFIGQNDNQISHRNFEERYTGVYYGCK